MNKISTEEVKVLQLEILTALDRFCKEKGIRYFIIDGTLLGAVRHGGYIPWDDDIDVGMMRSDYNCFNQEFPELLEKRYQLLSLERCSKWDRAYAVISDSYTAVQYEYNNSMAAGVSVDIFPVDEVPSSLSKWQKCIRRMKFYNFMLSIKSNTVPSFFKKPLKFTVASLCKILLIPVSQRKISEWKSKYAQSFNGCQSGLGYVMAFGISARERYLLKDFESFEEYPFEDRKFIGPMNYDSVLTRTYGNYMQLPPVEQRVTHHSLTAYYK